MSISFKLDNDNNIVTGSNIETITSTQALAQDIKTLLSMTAKEYPYDINMGIDYANLMQAGDKQGLLSAIQKRVLADRRVSSIAFDVSKENGTLIVRIKTTENEIITLK